MNSQNLFEEIEKISFHYKNGLPFEVRYENILKFEALLKINCKIDPNRITYFLTLPINYETEFDIYFMLSLPTKFKSDYVTIIPSSKFLLKSKTDHSIKPLFDTCSFGNPWNCGSKLQAHHAIPCEQQVLLNQNISKCQFTLLEIHGNHVEIVPEINEYLAVFPIEEKLTIQCETRSETKSLSGIFLIRKSSCKLIFQNQELVFQEQSYGKAEIVNIDDLRIDQQKLPTMKIELRKLEMRDMSVDRMLPIDNHPHSIYIPNIWTGILYILLVGGIFYIYILTKCKRIQTSQSQMENRENTTPNPNINLPGGASF